MRLLLDEHFSQMIAEALRARGHDVVAVAERPDLVGLADRLVFAAAVAEGRAVVTIDAVGYRAVAADELRRRAAGRGLVLVPVGPFHPPEKSGAVVRALDRLLRELPGDDDLVALRGGEHWLKPP